VRRYTVYVTPQAWKEIRNLPGNVRQRVRRAVGGLAEEPRPPRSKRLDVPDVENEVRRIRLERWRIIYGIDEALAGVDVLTVRKRPPYDYGDLSALIEKAQE
jgi:mRNA interferase RelE/StbE